MRRRLWWMGVVALALAAGGCGDDDGEAEVDRPKTAETADPACPYLTADAVGEAFGTRFEGVDGDSSACTFRRDDGLRVEVTRVEDVDVDVYYPGDAIGRCDEGSIVEVDVGDVSFACTDLGPLAVYSVGHTSIRITASTTEEDEATVDAFAALLPLVTLPV